MKIKDYTPIVVYNPDYPRNYGILEYALKNVKFHLFMSDEYYLRSSEKTVARNFSSINDLFQRNVAGGKLYTIYRDALIEIRAVNGDLTYYYASALATVPQRVSRLTKAILTGYGDIVSVVLYDNVDYVVDIDFTTYFNVYFGSICSRKFTDKWNRIYDALIDSQYNILFDKEYTEDKTGNNQNKDTHNTTKAKEGNNTDVMTYDTNSGKQGTNTNTTTFDTNVEDNGNTGTSEITTRNVSDENNVYGFNSSNAVGDTNSTETTTETVVGDADKNTSHNLQTKTGTESKEFGIDETITKTGTDSRTLGISESETYTGTDTKDITISEKIVRSGRDGSGAELITEELNLRNTQLFFDIVFEDIDSVTTLQIYI